jgi:hypothetical protein
MIMKHFRKHLICTLVVALLVSVVPINSYAAQGSQPTGKQFFSIDGTKYSIEKNQGVIRVQELKKGKMTSSCTAFIDDGYMLYEKNAAMQGRKAVKDVIWLDSMIAEVNPSNNHVSRASIVPTWTTDSKYVYKPALVSIFPTKYKGHTAFFKYQNCGTNNKTRQINFTKGTAIPVVATTIGVIIAAVSYFASPALAAAITIDMISGVGLDVSANCLTKAFAPTLSVDVTSYKTKFVDTYGNGTGQIFIGERLKVADVESKRYNKSYYEGYAPQLSQNFGYTAFLNSFKGTFIKYPGVKAYTEY